MRFTTISFLTCALMGTTVIADNCRKGLYYCGSVLLTRGMSTKHQTTHPIDHLSGNYFDQINGALSAAHQSQDSNHVNNSLFFCVNDANTNGNINFVSFCANGCQNGGDGHNDFCK